MLVQVVGCSHHGTSIAQRERLSFTPEQTREALDHWRRVFPGVEAVLLSTCNRVEVYAATERQPEPTLDQIAKFLARFHGLDPAEVLERLYQHSDEAAVQHLFAVAASLDSMVLGEPQILAQVKQAYQVATEQDNTGPLMHALFQAALRVARRVAGETAIHQRRVSIPSVAVADFARQIFERFDDKQALVIGAGEMAEECLRYLQEEGVRQITVVNRHFERAEELARQWGGRAVPWEELPQALEHGRSGGEHHGRRRADRHAGPVHGGRGATARAAAVDSRSGRAARLRARDWRSAGRVSLFDRRSSGGLPAEPRPSATRNCRRRCTSWSRRRPASWPRCTIARSAR